MRCDQKWISPEAPHHDLSLAQQGSLRHQRIQAVPQRQNLLVPIRAPA
jgi:hypothetical protein